MTSIWVVCEWYPYEGISELIKAFRTEEEAEMFMKSIKQNYDTSGLEIREVQLED